MRSADVLVIGGGIAGASAGAHLAESRRVILLEREAQPGYHSTGRSAALFSETYGNAAIRVLTRASRAFYESGAGGAAEYPLLALRGALVYAAPEQMAHLEEVWAELSLLDPAIRRLDAAAIRKLVPVLRPERAAAAILEPGAMDIDVHGLLSAYLRRLRRAGGEIVADAAVTALSRRAGLWHAATPAGDFAAPVIVNAAGAWADAVAGLAGLPPIGLVPKRRTVMIVAPPPGIDSRAWPLTIDIEETVYFKPESGRLLVSPADQTPVPPGDVQPEELDVAVAIERLGEVATIAVRRVERQWAGLRSFVADSTPVVGFDPLADAFFWLAGQGGYGIQTAEGIARSAAMLVAEGRLPADIARLGLEAAVLSPARLPRGG